MIDFKWEDNDCICTIKLKNNITFTGIAKCHPNDEDMLSNRVGEEISYHRALINVMLYERDCIIKPELMALKHLYASISNSKKFNPKGYETKMLRRQIKIKEVDLKEMKALIEDGRKILRQYINDKEKLYQKIRKKRNGQD